MMQWLVKHKIVTGFLICLLVYVGYRATVSPETRYDSYIQKAHKSIFWPVKVKNLQKAVKSSAHLGGLWNAGFWLYNNADYDAAETYFLQLTERYGHIPSRRVAEAYFLLGLLAQKKGLDSEKGYYEKAIVADPSLGFAYNKLARFYEGEELTNLYRMGIENDPLNDDNYWGLCQTYLDEMDFYEMSLEEFNELIPLEHASGQALTLLADSLYYEFYDDHLAYEILQFSLQKDDANALTYALLGDIYMYREQYSEAEKFLQAALRFDRSVMNAECLAYFYALTHQHDKVISTLLNALCYDDLSNFGKRLLATAHYQAGNFLQAYYWLFECGLTDPTLVQYMNDIKGNSTEVQKVIEDDAAANRKPVNVDRTLSQYIVRRQEQAEDSFKNFGGKGAIPLMEETLQVVGNVSFGLVAEMYYFLGKMLIIEQDLDKAANMFRKAITIDIRYGAAYAGLAQCLQGEERAQMLKQGIDLDPWAPENYIGLLKFFKENGTNLQTMTIDELQKQIPLEKAHSQVLMQIGEYLNTEKNSEATRFIYEQALAKSDSNPDLYRALGTIALSERQYEQARGYFTELVRDYDFIPIFSNERFEDYYSLATTYFESAKYDETINILAGCVEDEAFYPGKGVVMLAKAYFAKGDLDNALLWASKLSTSEGMDLRRKIKQKQ